MSEGSGAVPPDLDYEKWQAEMELRRREVSVREREQDRLDAESKRARWLNPLIIAIVGATITGVSSVAVSWWNGKNDHEMEAFKAESARILEMIHVTDLKKMRENLAFLAGSGLISKETADKIRTYLASLPPKQGPLLPVLSLTKPTSHNVEASIITVFTCLGERAQRQYWIYQYTTRPPGQPTFRVVLPPNWGQSIGGHDLFRRQDVEEVASDACISKG